MKKRYLVILLIILVVIAVLISVWAVFIKQDMSQTNTDIQNQDSDLIEKNEDTKCMCKEFREMASGTCHCGLYTKTE